MAVSIPMFWERFLSYLQDLSRDKQLAHERVAWNQRRQMEQLTAYVPIDFIAN